MYNEGILSSKQGGIPHLLASLGNHAKHADVVEQACWAVSLLAGCNDTDTVLIATEGGIPLILAALDNHAKHAGVVEEACWALNNVGSSDKTVQKSIKDAGAEKMVRTAVGWSDATANTKKYGQQLLDKLAKL